MLYDFLLVDGEWEDCGGQPVDGQWYMVRGKKVGVTWEMVVVQHFDGHLIWWAGSSGPEWTDGAEKGKEAVTRRSGRESEAAGEKEAEGEGVRKGPR